MRILKVMLALLIIALVGCATSSYSTGKNFDSSLVNKIVKGETTKDDLVRMFGQPFSKTVISENDEKWIYMYSSGTAKAQSYVITMKVESRGIRKILDILLKDGVVINYAYTEGADPAVNIQ